METKVQIFNSEEFGEIRTIEIDGEVWFVGKDIAEKLGYSASRNAISRHIDDEDKKIISYKGLHDFDASLWNGNDYLLMRVEFIH